jgi:hypothetical protein
MKKEYKSTTIRLVEFFETSRNQWKERSLKYQKEKRELQIQVRDLSRSKEKWKNECLLLKAENIELKYKEKKTKEILLNLIS